MERSELVKAHYDKLVEAGIALYREHPRYQVDLYLYPDGTVDTFTNVGGTSWLNDDHILVLSINHEYMDEADEVDEDDYLEVIRDQISGIIDERIAALEDDEKYDTW